MFEMIVVMAVAFTIIFVLSLLEAVWFTVYDDDVVAHESRHGSSAQSHAVKKLLRERLVVVGFILFLIHLATYFTPLLLGWLSRDEDGLAKVLLAFYAILLFFGGEVVSKNIGYRYATRSALLSAIPITWALRCSLGINWILRKLSGENMRLFREEDVVAAAKAAKEHGALHQQEVDFIVQTIAVGNKTVGDFLIPLAQCTKITTLRPTRRELKAAARQHSKIVVCPDGKTIIGILMSENLVNFLHGNPDDVIGISKWVRSVPNLPIATPIPEAIRLLHGQPIGVITARGKVLGIIVKNDIFDRIIESEGSENNGEGE